MCKTIQNQYRPAAREELTEGTTVRLRADFEEYSIPEDRALSLGLVEFDDETDTLPISVSFEGVRLWCRVSDLEIEIPAEEPAIPQNGMTPMQVGVASVAVQLLRQSEGKVFGCTARTRRGDVRVFNAKTYAGSFDMVASHGIVRVIEINATKEAREGGDGEAIGYRSIALEGVKSLRIGGKVIDFEAPVA